MKKQQRPAPKQNKKNRAKKRRPINRRNPSIDALGLNPDLYDASGQPIEWIDPESGALIGGDLFGALESDEVVQVIGDPTRMFEGAEPVLRELRLDDLEDDCPACTANRKRILSGNPPMAYVYE